MLNESLISLVLMKDDQKFLNNKLKYLYNTLEISLFGIQHKYGLCDDNYSKLVFQKSVFDDCFEGEVKFKKDLLRYNKNFDLIYNYDDINFYIFNKAIYKILENEHIKKKTLLKNDFIPFLINKSYKKILSKLIYGGKKKQTSNDSEESDDEFNNGKKENIIKNNKRGVDIMAFILDGVENYA